MAVAGSYLANGPTSPTRMAWAIGRRILLVHPAVYLSALLSTWLVLLSCNYISRETEMHRTAQRIRESQVAAESTAKCQNPFGKPRADIAENQNSLPVQPAIVQAPHAMPTAAKSSPAKPAAQTAKTNQMPVWQQITRVFQPAPGAQNPPKVAQSPKKARSSRGVHTGMVPPPPPVMGLVPPPPPTVPIPTSMLSAPPPAFGQSAYTPQPIPAGPGAAAASSSYYSPEQFYSSQAAGSTPVESLYAAQGYAADNHKVISHRHRKRTIAYR